VSLEPIFSYLRENGYNLTNEGVEISGWPVQFIPVSDSLTSDALAKAQHLPYDDELSVRVVRPEYLAAEAIKLGRPKDIQRIASNLIVVYSTRSSRSVATSGCSGPKLFSSRYKVLIAREQSHASAAPQKLLYVRSRNSASKSRPP
jgi:hypothetical protein